MTTFIIIIAVAAVILYAVYRMKSEKEYKESKAQKEEAYAQACAARKKDGEPSVCEALPFARTAPFVDKTVMGPDGKEYPYSTEYSTVYYNKTASDNLSSLDLDHKKYEYSPVYGMLASEHYIGKFMEKLEKYSEIHPQDVRDGLTCIYELAENYAYSDIDGNDLTQAEHYTIRRLQDRKRALEGNGYYKNAYGFPSNGEKALEYYELAFALSQKYPHHFKEIDTSGTATITKCWLQQAHLLSAQGQVEQAKKLYDQVFQMATYLSDEEQLMEVIHALVDGYPRKPADYETKVIHMLADWACNTDLGLAMYTEYTLYAGKLDRKRMAVSPEESVKLYIEQAQENHYAAYLLGRAVLYGYGIPRNENNGRAIIEAAANNGCVSALYTMTQLSIGYGEEEKKWKAALDRAVAAIAELCADVREALKQSGASVSQERFAQYRQEIAKTAEAERKQAWEQQRAQEEKSEKQEQERNKFRYPEQITLRSSGEILQLQFNYGMVAVYLNLDTGASVTLDRLDVERMQASPDVYL